MTWLRTRRRIGGQTTETPTFGEVAHAAVERLYGVAEESRLLTWAEVAVAGELWDGRSVRPGYLREYQDLWGMAARLAVQKHCLDRGFVSPRREHGKRGRNE